MDETTRRILRCAGGCLTVFIVLNLCILVYQLGYSPYSGMCELESRALAGNIPAQIYLSDYYTGNWNQGGLMLYHGRFTPDKQKSIYWMRTAAKTAAFQSPGEYEKKFAEIPNSQFMQWYEEGASQGNSKDAKRLADIYTYGQFGQHRDLKKAAHWRDVSRKNHDAKPGH